MTREELKELLEQFLAELDDDPEAQRMLVALEGD